MGAMPEGAGVTADSSIGTREGGSLETRVDSMKLHQVQYSAQPAGTSRYTYVAVVKRRLASETGCKESSTLYSNWTEHGPCRFTYSSVTHRPSGHSHSICQGRCKAPQAGADNLTLPSHTRLGRPGGLETPQK